ncbi:hypothetical protein Q9Q94_07565 [Uliginosibacterium sp. 31-16]|uniref:hypothetical protein n=1 Tax=Uliginosibacterium sp. 31-16 TaxID=3068315 RepID=UPI00273E8D78|nr:hypothetical protein [Uliginosibacterium sp. 31-16]MDP5239383.1 hypothetical protein [Uliginosibacterium sp. 31-16]
MKTLRVLLQLIILGAGGLTLAALITHPAADLVTIGGFLGFVLFLLALTLMLKEETEARLTPGRTRSGQAFGVALYLLGAFGFCYGASFLTGSQALPDGQGSCRAICRLVLLASQTLGDTGARLLAFSLWSGAGLCLCWLGYKVKRAQA